MKPQEKPAMPQSQNWQVKRKNPNKSLSHLTAQGKASMVSVAGKAATHRTARAQSIVVLTKEIISALKDGELYTKKGAVFQTAIIAGTMAAKKTGDLIPLCHPLGLDSCRIEIRLNRKREAVIECTTELYAKTGVEMEALVGASVAALTIYDMCKSMSHDIVIKETKLLEKHGGKSDFTRRKSTDS